MKLTKSDFKNMIKESIRELIKEGAFDGLMTENKKYFLPEDKASVLLNNPKGKTKSGCQTPKDAIQTEQARSRLRNIVGYGELIENEEASLEQSRIAATTLNETLQRAVENTAQVMAHGDPKIAGAYASIFADTALNTLPTMMAGDGSGLGMRREEQLKESVNVEQLQELAVDGDMSRWAKVAFCGK